MHPDKQTSPIFLVFIIETWQKGGLDAMRGLPDIGIRVCDEGLAQFGRTFESASFLSPKAVAASPKIFIGQGH
jgi:hypothetical protein